MQRVANDHCALQYLPFSRFHAYDMIEYYVFVILINQWKMKSSKCIVGWNLHSGWFGPPKKMLLVGCPTCMIEVNLHRVLGVWLFNVGGCIMSNTPTHPLNTHAVAFAHLSYSYSISFSMSQDFSLCIMKN